VLAGLVGTLTIAAAAAAAQPEPGAGAPAREAGALPDGPLTLAWCLDRALAENPAIAADAAAAAAAAHRIRPAGSLEDPRIGYQADNVPIGAWDFQSTPMSGNQLWLRQKLPFPGLLGSRKEAARAGARAATAMLDDRRARTAAAVEADWVQLGFARRALEITDLNIELLRQLQQVAEARYRVGSGLQQDVLLAQVELTRRLDERLDRVAAIERAESSLAALLDLPPGTRLPRTAEHAETAPVPELAELNERLEASSPLLRARAEHVAEAERNRRATQLRGYPDFDLGVGYRIRSDTAGDPVNGDDFVQAGVTVRLPIDRGKWREQVAEAEALLRRARAEHRGVRAQLRDALRATHADLVKADTEVELLEGGLLPQTRHALESSRSAYEVGRIDFLSLIDSEIRLFDAELRLERARAERRTSFARLEAIVGEVLR
jgi:outer membrane protein TolC